MLGAIELGGTKTNVAVGDGSGVLLAQRRIDTLDPETTLHAISDFFKGQTRNLGAISGLGVGAFGPIMLDRADPDFGRIGATTKPGWSGFDLRGSLARALDVPIALDTDVAAAGVGEYRHGALRDLGCGVYLTVGTGIGAAVLIEGKPISGRMHPEIGHLRIRRWTDDDAVSTCVFHDDCAEGLASGPAILARFGQTLDRIAPGDPEHALISDYLGQLCAAIMLAVSPHRIVLGGGVSNTPGLHTAVAQRMLVSLNGYAATGGRLSTRRAFPQS